MPLTHKSFTAQPESPEVGTRLDRIVQALCGWSRAQVAGLLDHGCVSLNGELCEEPGRVVAAGDTVALAYYPGQKYHVRPKARRNLCLLYTSESTFGRGQNTVGGITRTISMSHSACIHTLSAL